MSSAPMTMKLLIDKNNNRVLFAEAEKECVDFIFHVLALPIGSLMSCFAKEDIPGSLGNIYDSVKNLRYDCMQAKLSKMCLLSPRPAAGAPVGIPLLSTFDRALESGSRTLYTCLRPRGYSSCSGSVTEARGQFCRLCMCPMNNAVEYVAPCTSVKTGIMKTGGYVKEAVTYMITDNLVVRPLSTISSVTLLNRFNVKDMGCLEEIVVDLDWNQGMRLLILSMASRTVLTDVYLRV